MTRTTMTRTRATLTMSVPNVLIPRLFVVDSLIIQDSESDNDVPVRRRAAKARRVAQTGSSADQVNPEDCKQQ